MTVAALALRGARGLLDLVLPPRCLRCGLTVDGQDRLCVACWRSLTFLGPPQCRLCGYPLPHALPEALHDLRPEVLHQHVGPLDQTAHDLEPGWRLEVDGDRALAAVGRHEQGGELAGGIDRLPAAPRDVAGKRLDLDHVGPLVGQERGGERARNHAREIHHPYARQRTRHACLRVSFRHVYCGPPLRATERWF